MQTADYWQLLFSDRFTGARNPARLPTIDAIPSNPLRPLSPSVYHRSLEMARTPTLPEIGTGTRTGEALVPLYHVVLLDDDEHTYDYVVEMLTQIFCLSVEAAFRNAVEVDTTGRTIVITCELAQAEFGRDQIHSFGADPRMPVSKGSMSAIIEPARA